MFSEWFWALYKPYCNNGAFFDIINMPNVEKYQKKTFPYPLFHIIKHRKWIETIDMLFYKSFMKNNIQ